MRDKYIGNPSSACSLFPEVLPSAKAITEKGVKDKVILGVKDVDEIRNSMIKGAINIPADKIKILLLKCRRTRK